MILPILLVFVLAKLIAKAVLLGAGGGGGAA